MPSRWEHKLDKNEVKRRQFSRHRAIAYAALAAGCVIFALWAGKDINWDQRNYHFYAGLSAVHSRLEQDFMAASVQGYLQPYAYVPFYLLVANGLPDKSIVLLLALMVVPALWACWELGGRLAAGSPTEIKFSPAAAWSSAGLAALAPLFLTQIGTSFADATTAVLVLWALVAICMAFEIRSYLLIVCSALLMAAASALKLTNVFWACFAIILVSFIPGERRQRAKSCGLYAFCGLFGFIAFMYPWGSKLYDEFKNPVPPFFNTYFASPDFPSWTSRHERFVSTSLPDALAMPIRMLLPERNIYTESIAPDARFLFLFLALLAILLIAVVKSIRRRQLRSVSFRGNCSDLQTPTRHATARLTAFSIYFLVCWTFWVFTSGNGRYLMPVALLAGPLLVGLVWQVSHWRWRTYALLAVLLTQVSVLVLGSESRWGQAPWSGKWFDVDIPKQLLEKPALYLSMDTQTNSFLAGLVHPRSGFVNVSGQLPLVPGHPGWNRLESLLGKYQDVYFLSEVEYTNANRLPLKLQQSDMDPLTSRFGLRSDQQNCLHIEVRGLKSHTISTSGTTREDFSIKVEPYEGRFVLACPAAQAPGLRDTYFANLEAADKVFDRFIARCPRTFLPIDTPTIGGVGDWRRVYIGTDNMLRLINGTARWTYFRASEEVIIGTVDDVLANAFSIDCTAR